MADRDKAKQKKRLKREQKRRDHARHEQQRQRTLSWATGPSQCYITADWRERGMGDLMILRESPRGDWAFAGFLIDTYCIGLKDALAADDYTPEDFRDVLDHARDVQELATLSLDEARRIVASAIRWSRMHHFRLPKGWGKAVSILGDLGDIEAADITGYGKDGTLLYTGRESDLVARLTDQSLADFLERPDVEVAFVAEGMAADEAEMMDTLQETIGVLGARIAGKVRQWCFRVGRKPEEELEAACGLVTAVLMQERSIGPDPDTFDPERFRQSVMQWAQQGDREHPEEPSVMPAAAQVLDFVLSDEGQQMLEELLQEDDEWDDTDDDSEGQ